MSAMGAFSFICKKKGAEWSAKCRSEGHDELEASAGDQYALERKLRQLAIDNSQGGAVSTSFNYVTPTAAVFVVSVGVSAAFAAAPAAGGATARDVGAPAAEEAPAKEEEAEESDEDMGFSLFD